MRDETWSLSFGATWSVPRMISPFSKGFVSGELSRMRRACGGLFLTVNGSTVNSLPYSGGGASGLVSLRVMAK